MTWRDFLAGVTACWDDRLVRNGIEPLSVKDAVETYDFLFLDDVKIRQQASRDPVANYAWDAANELVDRIEYHAVSVKLLYLTTNMSLEQLSDTFGVWFTDRVGAICSLVEVSGRSFR